MSTKPKILLVDDDPDDLMLLKEAIISLSNNYQISEAGDGRTALNLLKEAKKIFGGIPCLMVLDINMPVLDGREVLAIVKSDEELKKLPVVVFTTSSNPRDINYCRQFNVDLITKPSSITALEEIAKRMITYCRPVA